MRCLLFLYFVSFFSSAASCIQTEEQVKTWDAKYNHLFSVSSDNRNGSFSVIVSLPKKLEEYKFDSVWVVVGDKDDPLFALPTTVVDEDGETKAWFIAKPIAGEEYSFIFGYGKGCGISIEVPVQFK